MNIKIIIGLILLFAIMAGGWLFMWPLTECWYAWSWEPLLLDAHKFYSFVLGGIIFWGSVLCGIRILV